MLVEFIRRGISDYKSDNFLAREWMGHGEVSSSTIPRLTIIILGEFNEPYPHPWENRRL